MVEQLTSPLELQQVLKPAATQEPIIIVTLIFMYIYDILSRNKCFWYNDRTIMNNLRVNIIKYYNI